MSSIQDSPVQRSMSDAVFAEIKTRPRGGTITEKGTIATDNAVAAVKSEAPPKRTLSSAKLPPTPQSNQLGKEIEASAQGVPAAVRAELSKGITDEGVAKLKNALPPPPLKRQASALPPQTQSSSVPPKPHPLAHFASSPNLVQGRSAKNEGAKQAITKFATAPKPLTTKSKQTTLTPEQIDRRQADDDKMTKTLKEAAMGTVKVESRRLKAKVGVMQNERDQVSKRLSAVEDAAKLPEHSSIKGFLQAHIDILKTEVESRDKIMDAYDTHRKVLRQEYKGMKDGTIPHAPRTMANKSLAGTTKEVRDISKAASKQIKQARVRLARLDDTIKQSIITNLKLYSPELLAELGEPFPPP